MCAFVVHMHLNPMSARAFQYKMHEFYLVKDSIMLWCNIYIWPKAYLHWINETHKKPGKKFFFEEEDETEDVCMNLQNSCEKKNSRCRFKKQIYKYSFLSSLLLVFSSFHFDVVFFYLCTWITAKGFLFFLIIFIHLIFLFTVHNE